MTATKIDGTAIARSIRERLGEQIKQRQQTNPRYRPSLKIVQGESGDARKGPVAVLTMVQWETDQTRVRWALPVDESQQLTSAGTYVRMKLKAAEEVMYPKHPILREHHH